MVVNYHHIYRKFPSRKFRALDSFIDVPEAVLRLQNIIHMAPESLTHWQAALVSHQPGSVSEFLLRRKGEKSLPDVDSAVNDFLRNTVVLDWPALSKVPAKET